jgi:hypothetical protein
MADYVPVYASGTNPFTKTASADVVGGRLVEATTASSVGPAGAASTKVLGVAAYDATTGNRVSIWPLAGLEHEVLGSGAIAVGDGVAAGAAGVITTVVVGTGAAAGTLIGRATTAGTGVKVRFVGGS